MEKRTPADFLEEIAGIYRQRKPLYGDNYKHVGTLMRGIFYEGLTIDKDDEDTWNRLHLIFHMVSKLTRYAQNLQKGGHQDSLDDLAVYAMLARECDDEERGEVEAERKLDEDLERLREEEARKAARMKLAEVYRTFNGDQLIEVLKRSITIEQIERQKLVELLTIMKVAGQ